MKRNRRRTLPEVSGAEAALVLPPAPAGTFLGPVAVVLHPGAEPLLLPTWNQPDSGRLCIQARTSQARTGWLAKDLLTACGADGGVTGWGRNASHDAAVLLARLVSSGVNALVCDQAQALSPCSLTDLIELGVAAGTRTFLVFCAPPSPAQFAVLTRWTGVSTDNAALLALLEPTIAVTPAATDPRSPRPAQVPTDDVTTFLPACKRLLPTDEYTWVEETLRAQAIRTQTWLADLAAAPNDEHTIAMLQELYDEAGDLAELTTRLRGVQLALLRAGWYLRVDLDQVCGQAMSAPRRSHRTEEVWRRMRSYRHPHRGAACALLAAHLDVEQVRALLVSEVREDGSAVRTEAGWVELEPGSHEFIAGQVLLRRSEGALPGEPLLVNTNDGSPVTDRAVAGLATDARRQLGVLVTSRRVQRLNGIGQSWTTRGGVHLTALGAPLAAPALTAPPAGHTPAPPAQGTLNKKTADSGLVNGELLRLRRLAAGMSRRQLATVVGSTPVAVKNVETGVSGHLQELQVINALAAAMGLSVGELCGPPQERASRATAEPTGVTPSQDVAALGAALHRLAVLTPYGAIAAGLGWDLPRLHVAASALEAQLPLCGLRLHRVNGQLGLVSAVSALTAPEWLAVARADVARMGLRPIAARLLFEVLHAALSGKAVRRYDETNPQRVALGELFSAALVAGGSTPQVAEEVLDALLLTPLPTRGNG